jgi:hypothetical protein
MTGRGKPEERPTVNKGKGQRIQYMPRKEWTQRTKEREKKKIDRERHRMRGRGVEKRGNERRSGRDGN